MSTKALALDNFLPGLFSKTKSQSFSKKGEVSNFRFWLSVGLIAANTVLLMSYIYGVNESASKGYHIQSLQKTLAALNLDNKQVSLKVATASSMVTIQSDFLSANFVPAGTPKFLQVPQFSMNQK